MTPLTTTMHVLNAFANRGYQLGFKLAVYFSHRTAVKALSVQGPGMSLVDSVFCDFGFYSLRDVERLVPRRANYMF